MLTVYKIYQNNFPFFFKLNLFQTISLYVDNTILSWNLLVEIENDDLCQSKGLSLDWWFRVLLINLAEMSNINILHSYLQKAKTKQLTLCWLINIPPLLIPKPFPDIADK